MSLWDADTCWPCHAPSPRGDMLTLSPTCTDSVLLQGAPDALELLQWRLHLSGPLVMAAKPPRRRAGWAGCRWTRWSCCSAPPPGASVAARRSRGCSSSCAAALRGTGARGPPRLAHASGPQRLYQARAAGDALLPSWSSAAPRGGRLTLSLRLARARRRARARAAAAARLPVGMLMAALAHLAPRRAPAAGAGAHAGAPDDLAPRPREATGMRMGLPSDQAPRPHGPMGAAGEHRAWGGEIGAEHGAGVSSVGHARRGGSAVRGLLHAGAHAKSE